MPTIQDYAGANKILKVLHSSKGDYNTLPERLTAIENSANTGAEGSLTNQATKMNITASVGSPYIEEFSILANPTFKRPPIEVLKFVAGGQNQVTTICNFDNGDSSSFDANASYVVFDGTMHLKTSSTVAMTNEGTLSGDSSLFSVTLDRTNYNIESVQVL